ncbi:hypothetical protein Bbelb_140320 [Branchiostoma belcheri]|nr:hypothetical protein Bbelb_140320 [Branchiostoma belcheri]
MAFHRYRMAFHRIPVVRTTRVRRFSEMSVFRWPDLNLEYYGDTDGETFCVVSKHFSGRRHIHRMSASRSLYIFSPFNKLRRIAVYIAVHRYPFS